MKIEAKRSDEAKLANVPAGQRDDPEERRPEVINPVNGQANISTGGAMVLTREEGWKRSN